MEHYLIWLLEPNFALTVSRVATTAVCLKTGVHAFYFNVLQSALTLRLLMSYIHIYIYIYIYIYMERPFLMFLDHTQRRRTVGRTPLDE